MFSYLIDKLRMGATKPQVFAYQLTGARTNRFLPMFRDVDTNLKKSGMKINFRAYISTVIMTSLLLVSTAGTLAAIERRSQVDRASRFLRGRYPRRRTRP